MADRTIQIIANPGAGQEGLNLKIVQRILAGYPVIWDLAITRQAGDACRLARAAAEADRLHCRVLPQALRVVLPKAS
ncbi:MAG: hypothetical protein H3C34_02530 [Caldilineaceae bacterium]|nr:hypothetical protein [Caldilineaceae bacterium]